MTRLFRISNVRWQATGIFLGILCALLSACHSGRLRPRAQIEITETPVSDAGGPSKLDLIQGKVTGAKEGQQIVIYAKSEFWWIQPFANQPFTNVQPDSTWKNLTHLGTEYAALLVEPGYQPASKTISLPQPGNGVIAVATAKGKPGRPLVKKTIHFSGYDWTVRTAGSDRGGEPNEYDPENAWTDDKGYLHLRMQERNGRWSCAEVNLMRSLGYGTYRFVVQNSAHLAPSAVVGLFTWDELGSLDTRKELDIELSRWGNPSSKNSQYVVQPFYIPENVVRFSTPGGVMTHLFHWEPGKATFQTLRGRPEAAHAAPISEHTFTSGIPTPASETVHIDLYDFHHSKTSTQHPDEVVIEKFEFLP